MIRSLVRLGIATLLLEVLALPAWADAIVEEVWDGDWVVVPGGWGLEEATDGWWVYPDGVEGYSEYAQVLLVDDFYNQPFDDPASQVATIFGYLTSGYEIVERPPAVAMPAEEEFDDDYYSITGYRPKSNDLPRLQVTAILLRNPDGTERAYFIESETDEETLDLLMLCGMLNGSRSLSDEDVNDIDLETYIFTHQADYAEEGE